MPLSINELRDDLGLARSSVPAVDTKGKDEQHIHETEQLCRDASDDKVVDEQHRHGPEQMHTEAPQDDVVDEQSRTTLVLDDKRIHPNHVDDRLEQGRQLGLE